MDTQDNFSHVYQDFKSNLCVVYFDDNITFRISKLLEIANNILRNQALQTIDERLRAYGIGSLSIINQNKENAQKNKENWNINGMDAEILEPNAKAWKKGKIRMRVVLEFCPEESEEEQPEIVSSISPLDDIRKIINE